MKPLDKIENITVVNAETKEVRIVRYNFYYTSLYFAGSDYCIIKLKENAR